MKHGKDFEQISIDVQTRSKSQVWTHTKKLRDKIKKNPEQFDEQLQQALKLTAAGTNPSSSIKWNDWDSTNIDSYLSAITLYGRKWDEVSEHMQSKSVR